MSSVKLPPDQTGVSKNIQTKDHGDFMTQAFHLADIGDPRNYQRVDAYGAAQVSFSSGSPAFDSYSRMYTATEEVLFSCVLSNDMERLGEIHSEGDAFIDAQGSQVLRTGTVSGDQTLVRTHRYFRYEPGFSNKAVFTATLGEPKANVEKRIGIFDDSDGMFLMVDGEGLKAGIRNSTSGVIEENLIHQADFNVDPLDGTGASGLAVDLSKHLVWWIRYQWLGAGEVSMGVIVNGIGELTVHQFKHFNSLDYSYTRTGTLPFSAEINNTGTSASSTEFKMVCFAIATTADKPKVMASGVIEIDRTFTATDGEVPIIAVQAAPYLDDLETEVNRYIINMAEFTAMVMPGDETDVQGLVRLTLYDLGEVSGGDWGLENQYKLIDCNQNATALVDGRKLNSKIIPVGQMLDYNQSNLYDVFRHARPETGKISVVTAEIIQATGPVRMIGTATFQPTDGR